MQCDGQPQAFYERGGMGRREHQSDTMAKKKTKMNMARIAMITTITRFKVCCTIAHANNMLVPIILVAYTQPRVLGARSGYVSLCQPMSAFTPPCFLSFTLEISSSFVIFC